MELKEKEITQLKSEVKSLYSQIRAREHKISNMLRDTLLPDFIKRFEGKFFQADNSYGDGRKWKIYYRVLSIDKNSIKQYDDGVTFASCKAVSFQKSSDGNIEISIKEHVYISLLGREITERTFIEQWNKLIDKINKLPI